MTIPYSGTTVNAVDDLGIDNGGATDVTDKINDALRRHTHVHLPAGNYRVGGGTPPHPGVEMTLLGPSFASFDPQNGKRLSGAGPNATYLTVANGEVPGISVHPAGLLSNASIVGLTITRSSSHPAIAGADGLVVHGGGGSITPHGANTRGFSNQVFVSNVTSILHDNGFNLGPTLFSVAQNCIAENNSGSGFLLTNRPDPRYSAGIYPAIQWSLNSTFSQNNKGWGYLVAGYSSPWTGANPPFVVLNTWLYPYTNNNSLGGIAVIAGTVDDGRAPTTLASVHDFTVIGGWIDQDGFFAPRGPGIYLNTNGGTHRIIDTHVEFAGTYGIHVDGLTNGAGNGDVQISGTSVFSCGKSGIAVTGPASFSPFPGNPNPGQPNLTLASEVQLEGCRITRNGQLAPGYAPIADPAATPFYCGIDLANLHVSPAPFGGSATITGCRVGNDLTPPAPANPAYGLQYAGISATAGTFVASCDLSRNGPGGPILGNPHPASGSNRLD